MSQVSKRFTPDFVYQEIYRFLQISIKATRDSTIANEFIDVILTDSEKTMIGKRVAIAFLLRKGANYEEISSILRVSRGTIARVKSRLEQSEKFQMFIDRILKKEEIEIGLLKLVERLGDVLGGGSPGRFWREMGKIAAKDRKKSIITKV